MESTYSTSSFVGLVSSNRKLQMPPRSCATPKFRQIDFAWPMCRYPFGSGGKRVRMAGYFPAATSCATISRMKSEGVGAGSLVISGRVNYQTDSGRFNHGIECFDGVG